MLRIALFLGTNIAILVVLSLTMSLFGIDGVLQDNGVDLDLNSLLFISAIIGFTGSFISLLISKWVAKRSMGVELVKESKNETERWLLNTLEEISLKSRIKTPEFGIFNSQQPNAFATGASKNNSLVALSTGLISHMNRDEIEAVIAHEVAHIKNGDMVTMTLIQGIINTFVIFFFKDHRTFC